MKAVIMAGGEGTRLRPLTCDLPKPMVPVLNKPIMEHIINLLKKHGITDIAVTLAYLPEKIKEYFQDGRDFEVNLKYFVETEPLGTAGSVKNAEEFLDSDFIVISGDALTDIDLSKAVEFHRKNNAAATLVLKKVEVPLEYGVVVTGDNGKILNFLEKPSWSEVISDTVNTGIYVLSPEVLKYCKKGEKCDFGKNIFPDLLKDGKPLYGYVADGYWCDIGDANAYAKASRDALNGKVQVLKDGFEFFNNVWISKGCEVEEGAILKPKCIIGRNCRISKDAEIDMDTIIGNNVTISAGCSLKSAIIWDNCIIGENVELRGNIVCDRTRIDRGARAFEGSIIGYGSHVKENATIHQNIKIWPGKIIDTGTEVSENLVWGKGASRDSIAGLTDMEIFRGRGIKGNLNGELVPEQLTRLGVAFGAVLSPGAKIAVATDGSAGAQMSAMSFMSGAMAQGARVFDCGKITIPMLRFAVREYNMEGGAFFIGVPADELEIILINSQGFDIDRNVDKKVRSIYRRNDFALCSAAQIRHYSRLSGISGQYVASMAKRSLMVPGCQTDTENDSSSWFTVAIGGNAEICQIAGEVFREKGCIVRSIDTGKYDMGIIFAPNGEKLDLYDENKNKVESEILELLISNILFETYENCTMIVPVSGSAAFEKIAERYNAKLVRTGVSPRDIMNKIAANLIKEGSDAQFNMRFDAVACACSIIDFIKSRKTVLSSLLKNLPDIFMEKRDVDCDFSKKGRVMRKMIQENDSRAIETIDGIKIYSDKGWVLVLPDPDRPICRIVAESSNMEFAQELADFYTEKIKEITLN